MRPIYMIRIGVADDNRRNNKYILTHQKYMREKGETQGHNDENNNDDDDYVIWCV